MNEALSGHLGHVNMNIVFQKLLDEIDVGVHVIDKEGRTILYNKKMMQIEAMDSEDVLDRELLDVFQFAKEQESTLLQALTHGKVTNNVKQTYYNNKGREITTINHTHPIIEDGQIIGAIEIAKDVTKLERLMRKNADHKGGTRYTFASIIGESEAMQSIIELAKRITRTSSSVLIIGETGTGKELFAQSIHNGSDRAAGPYIAQNCAAMPDSLVESILFGTKQGAFTGAENRPGLFEQAEGGTLLLDEINALSPSLQAKLLRAIQEKKFRRIGDTQDRTFDVRIIATMNEDPLEAIAQNRLRKDLYYRLSVVSLFIPPLRERKEDIPLLVRSFVDKYNRLFQMDITGAEADVLQLFMEYDWPGNVRELEHVIEGAMNVMTGAGAITMYDLPHLFSHKIQRTHPRSSSRGAIHEIAPNEKTLKEQLETVERYIIQKTLRKNASNVTRTASALGISRQSLQYRMRKYHIQTERT